MSTSPASSSNPAGTAQATSILINAAVGAGVLSLPFAFKCAGWLGGILILFAVALIESFTLYILSRWAEATGAKSYGELVHRSLGPLAAAILNIVVFLYLFGSCVAYLIIIGDCIHPLVDQALPSLALPFTRNTVIAVVGTVTILPMCFARTLSSAASISVVNFCAFIIVILTLMVRSIQTIVATDVHQRFEDVHMFVPGTWPKALPIAVFGLQCHAQVVSVFTELSIAQGPGDEEEEVVVVAVTGGEEGLPPPATKQKSKNLTRMIRVIIYAIEICALGYCLTGLFAYLAFPTTIQSNILNTFPSTDALMQVVRGVVGILEIASYPVNHLPARHAVQDAVYALSLGRIRLGGGWGFIITETLLFYGASLGLALVVTDLGAVFTLTGGVCGSAFILGMPGLLLMNYAWGKHCNGKVQERLTSSLLEEEHEEREEEDRHGVPYSAWKSKFFWSGVSLVVASVALISYTAISVLQ